MKKVFSVLAAALCLAGITPTAQAAQTEDGLVAVAHFNTLEGCLNGLTDVLATIKDRESADAAVPQFLEAVNKLKQQLDTMAGLQDQLKGLPNAEDNAAFEACQQRLQAAGIALQQELARLAMVEFYGSEQFIQALMSMQNVAQ